jgi:cell filamentation protein, protein adenylyltransferase
MYEVETDTTYCYPGTIVLKNKLDLRDPAKLAEFEAEITAQRASEPLPAGRLDEKHYRAIHRHLFQDVYDWAGDYRTIRIGKEGNWFCYPENVREQMALLFGWLAKEKHLQGLDKVTFAKKAAHFLAELNAIHPFREGNGRTQLSFLAILADRAGHPFDMDGLKPDAMLKATIASFNAGEGLLFSVLSKLIK